MCLGPELLAGLGGLGTALGGASTLIPLAGGIGASVLGGQLQANAQRNQQNQVENQNLAAATARNAVLQNFLNQNSEYQRQNKGTLNTAFGNVTNIAGQQADQTQQRVNDANSAIDTGTSVNVAPASSGATSAAQGDLNKRSSTAITKAKAGAAASAALGGYGDANASLDTSRLNAGRNIDTVNSFARGDASLLPYQQEFADFGQRVSNPVQPVSTFGQGLQGLGNVFAALAGSGKFPKFG